MKQKVNLFWFRRDLRLNDNHGLFASLQDKSHPTLCVFIFDNNILKKLPKNDLRVNFIHQNLLYIKKSLNHLGSDLYVAFDSPENAFLNLFEIFDVNRIYSNSDYEPYAIKRDFQIKTLSEKNHIEFKQFKDQVVFEPKEILNSEGKPFKVFSQFYKKYKEKLNEKHLQNFEIKDNDNFLKITNLDFPSLESMGFESASTQFPRSSLNLELLKEYEELRNIPSKDSTSKLGIHLRFGTISIRKTMAAALSYEPWLQELVWREFFMHILYFYPQTIIHDFNPKVYQNIKWENGLQKIEKWKKGETGYPLVDAGMRELNQTGHIHNRVRMLVASFLVKNLMIDWRIGERYFAEKLLDFDLSANVGNWQWCAGCGVDAAPHFRIFNPTLQQEKFDPDFLYIKKWIPNFDPKNYIEPIVDFKTSRDRFLSLFKK